MADAPLTLAELQARFQNAVVNGDDAVLSLIPANSRTTNAVLFGVYRYAYAARLVEILRGSLPVLALYMGDEAFDAMARRYVADYPSRHANARWYAVDVPNMLAGPAYYAEHPEFAEIALLEITLDGAFDAADAPVIDLAALAQFPPDVWGGLAFRPHPSATLIEATTNAFDIWRALKNGDEQPFEARVLDETESLLVWRRDAVPTVRTLTLEERMLWIEVSQGATFGALCEMAAMFDDPDNAALRVAQQLHGWLSSGLLSEVVT